MTDHDGLLLPEGTRLIHIGHPKSGSTALQSALIRERASLGDHGVVYPSKTLRPSEAGWAVLGIGPPIGRPQPRKGAWTRLRKRVTAAGESRVCISNEDFARADADAVVRIVDGLGGDRAHIALVPRRLDRTLPSQWQERVKARQVLTFDEYLRALLADPPTRLTLLNSWINDLPGLVGRWVDVVGPERFTLIVGVEHDHSRVPVAFERMLGLPDGLLVADPTRSNRGLSLNETEWLREINQHFIAGDFSNELYHQLIQSGFLAQLKRTPRDPMDLPLPHLPDWAAERVAELDEQRMTIAGRYGILVIGDLESLRSGTTTDTDVEPPTALSIETAARGVSGIITAAARNNDRVEARHAAELAELARKPQDRLLSDASGRELARELRSRAADRLRRR